MSRTFIGPFVANIQSWTLIKEMFRKKDIKRHFAKGKLDVEFNLFGSRNSTILHCNSNSLFKNKKFEMPNCISERIK